MIAHGRYAIVTDQPGWHGHQLRRALEAKGLESDFVRLQECCLEVQNGAPKIGIPGFEDELPSGVFIREVPGGSLEEVIFYLDILHALEALGIMVYNDAGAIERSVDKVRASFLFALHGVPTPRTFAVRDVGQMREFLRNWFESHRHVVAKPIFGSQGKGLKLLSRDDPHPDYDLSRGIYYLQEYIEPVASRSCDWRVLVIGGRAVAAMRREGEDWISNIANGGQGYPASLEPELSQLAERAVAAVAMPYAGVDLMRDRKETAWVTEVNSIPAWRGLQEVHSENIAELLIEGFLDHCHGGASPA